MELNFKLSREELPVILDGKNYKLKELTGKQRDTFLNNVGQRMNFVAGKAQGMKSYDGLQSSLLALCLYDDADKLVSEKDIQEYPASVQTKLFKAAQELNGLDEEAVEEAKND